MCGTCSPSMTSCWPPATTRTARASSSRPRSTTGSPPGACGAVSSPAHELVERVGARDRGRPDAPAHGVNGCRPRDFAADLLAQAAADAIAGAGLALERGDIANLDVAAADVHDVFRLQYARDQRDRGALDAQNPRQQFLRHGHDVAAAAVARLQQPAAQAGLHRVHRVAYDGLL